MSHRIEFHPWPMPCGVDSETPLSHAPVLIES